MYILVISDNVSIVITSAIFIHTKSDYCSTQVKNVICSDLIHILMMCVTVSFSSLIILELHKIYQKYFCIVIVLGCECTCVQCVMLCDVLKCEDVLEDLRYNNSVCYCVIQIATFFVRSNEINEGRNSKEIRKHAEN